MKNATISSYGAFPSFKISPNMISGKSALSSERNQTKQSARYFEKLSIEPTLRQLNRHRVKASNQKPNEQIDLRALLFAILTVSTEVIHVTTLIKQAPKPLNNDERKRIIPFKKSQEEKNAHSYPTASLEATIKPVKMENNASGINGTSILNDGISSFNSSPKTISESKIFGWDISSIKLSLKNPLVNRINNLVNVGVESLFTLAFGPLGSVALFSPVRAEEFSNLYPPFTPKMNLDLDKVAKVLYMALRRGPTLEPISQGDLSSWAYEYENMKNNPLLEGKIKPFAHQMHETMNHYREYHDENPLKADLELKGLILTFKLGSHAAGGPAGIALAFAEMGASELLGAMVNGITGEHLEKYIGYGINSLADGIVRLDPTVTKEEAISTVGMLLGTALITSHIHPESATAIHHNIEKSLLTNLKNSYKNPGTFAHYLEATETGLHEATQEAALNQILNHESSGTSGSLFSDDSNPRKSGNAFDQLKPSPFDFQTSNPSKAEKPFDTLNNLKAGNAFKQMKNSLFSFEDSLPTSFDDAWGKPKASPFDFQTSNPSKAEKLFDTLNNLKPGNAFHQMKFDDPQPASVKFSSFSPEGLNQKFSTQTFDTLKPGNLFQQTQQSSFKSPSFTNPNTFSSNFQMPQFKPADISLNPTSNWKAPSFNPSFTQNTYNNPFDTGSNRKTGYAYDNVR